MCYFRLVTFNEILKSGNASGIKYLGVHLIDFTTILLTSEQTARRRISGWLTRRRSVVAENRSGWHRGRTADPRNNVRIYIHFRLEGGCGHQGDGTLIER
jgi:hypothetical protein